MTPYFQDSVSTLWNKDCRSMAELPDESIQCCVTSPPYWGLRRYAGEQELIWGGKPDCEHTWARRNHRDSRGIDGSTLGGTFQAEVLRLSYSEGFCSLCGAWCGGYGLEPTIALYVQHTVEILREVRRVLRKDGVVFWNIGDSYCGSWANYGGGNRGAGKQRPIIKGSGAQNPVWEGLEGYRPPASYPQNGVKAKDLCLIPFRVALAAQDDGWWVRSAIIWNKPNPMPESVTDRPTESHEYILMLTKSKDYYWDSFAVRESSSSGAANRAFLSGPALTPKSHNLRSVWEFPTQPYPKAHFATFPEALPERCIKAATPEMGCCEKCGTPWERDKQGEKRYNGQHEDLYEMQEAEAIGGVSQGSTFEGWSANQMPSVRGRRGKNKISSHEGPQGGTGPSLSGIEQGEDSESKTTLSGGQGQGENAKCQPPILCDSSRSTSKPGPAPGVICKNGEWQAECSPTVCTPEGLVNGAASSVHGRGMADDLIESEEKVPLLSQAIQRKKTRNDRPRNPTDEGGKARSLEYSSSVSALQFKEVQSADTPSLIGWRPACSCGAHSVPSTVLDPFAGSGTTLWVAKKLGRRSVGYELSTEYCQLALDRNRQGGLI